jgi:glycine C-acetyltransferase
VAYQSFKKAVAEQLAAIRAAGLYKTERRLLGPQGARIRVAQAQGPGDVLNLCANNYLGLANHPDIVEAAADGLREHGYGMASVRFICGTQDLHKKLEQALSDFLGAGDTILYGSCFDANTGLFETLLDERDAVISDALNHASLIDGIRLCKARRFRYAHSDMQELEAALKDASSCRLRLIATDGVFSMDGDLAKLDRIVELADRYDAAVVVDDSHATGVLGEKGRGTPAHFGGRSSNCSGSGRGPICFRIRCRRRSPPRHSGPWPWPPKGTRCGRRSGTTPPSCARNWRHSGLR